MAWQLVLDDSFVHADTTAGGAGSFSGVPTTPVVGSANSWKDLPGGMARISVNQLSMLADAAGDYPHRDLLRTDITGNPDQRLVISIASSQGTFGHIGAKLRYLNSSNFYLFEWAATTAGLAIYSYVGGVLTTLRSSTLTITSSHGFSLDISASGSSPTALSAIVTDTTTSTVAGTLSTTDSSAALQASGLSYTLTQWSNSALSTSLLRVQGYNLVTTPAQQLQLGMGHITLRSRPKSAMQRPRPRPMYRPPAPARRNPEEDQM